MNKKNAHFPILFGVNGVTTFVLSQLLLKEKFFFIYSYFFSITEIREENYNYKKLFWQPVES